jgi:epoxyqueuosine reductase
VNNNAIVEKIAFDLGFNLVGFSRSELLTKETEQLREWLDKGYHSGMLYMERNIDKRLDPKKILPSVRSVISLGLNYYQSGGFSDRKGKVSRYAWGRDYHLVIWEKLKEFESLLKLQIPLCMTISYVDTGAVMDKVWAMKSGLGWMGKHSNIINREWGSWFFIANIFSDIEFEYSTPIEDFCGSCTLCLDSCPTGAIVDKYIVDANRCISYQTIENKGEIDKKLEWKFENWVFGCDICQDVCPWNKKFQQTTTVNDFISGGKDSFTGELRGLNKEFELYYFDNLENKDFKLQFAESPILRSKLKGMKRNSDFLRRMEEDERE